jgi:hypothetical protein
MTTSGPPPLTVAQPGGGRVGQLGDIGAMWNAGPVPARMIEIISPAGFEHFFREVAEIIAAGPAAAGEGGDLAERYGLQFGEPEWLPGIIERFGLTT